MLLIAGTIGMCHHIYEFIAFLFLTWKQFTSTLKLWSWVLQILYLACCEARWYNTPHTVGKWVAVLISEVWLELGKFLGSRKAMLYSENWIPCCGEHPIVCMWGFIRRIQGPSWYCLLHQERSPDPTGFRSAFLCVSVRFPFHTYPLFWVQLSIWDGACRMVRPESRISCVPWLLFSW